MLLNYLFYYTGAGDESISNWIAFSVLHIINTTRLVLFFYSLDQRSLKYLGFNFWKQNPQTKVNSICCTRELMQHHCDADCDQAKHLNGHLPLPEYISYFSYCHVWRILQLLDLWWSTWNIALVLLSCVCNSKSLFSRTNFCLQFWFP